MFKRRRSKTQSPHNSVGSGVSANNNRQDTAGGGSAGGAGSGGGASESGGSGGGGGGGGSGGGSDGGSSSQNSPPIPRGCIRLTSSNSDGPGNGSNGTLTVSLEGADGNSNLTTSTATNKSRSIRRQRRVRFRHVVVREFERVIGDNPSCSGGAPISYVTGGALCGHRKLDESYASNLPPLILPSLILTDTASGGRSVRIGS
jgi:hypothetical protein